MPSTAGQDYAASLIDDLLELRDNPFPHDLALLEEMLGDVKREGPRWQAHLAAIDAALDLLVPALQRVMELPSPPSEEHTCGNNYAGKISYQFKHEFCIPVTEIRRIIGRVPKRITGRYQR